MMFYIKLHYSEISLYVMGVCNQETGSHQQISKSLIDFELFAHTMSLLHNLFCRRSRQLWYLPPASFGDFIFVCITPLSSSTLKFSIISLIASSIELTLKLEVDFKSCIVHKVIKKFTLLNGIMYLIFFSGGKPISESLDSVRLACVHTTPANRFKYVWKFLRPEQVSNECM